MIFPPRVFGTECTHIFFTWSEWSGAVVHEPARAWRPVRLFLHQRLFGVQFVAPMLLTALQVFQMGVGAALNLVDWAVVPHYIPRRLRTGHVRVSPVQICSAPYSLGKNCPTTRPRTPSSPGSTANSMIYRILCIPGVVSHCGIPSGVTT